MYEGVILAAGKGRRIRPFSDRVPKPLLPLLDRPLIAWQIESMRDLGIERITIVIGHLGHRIVETLGDGSSMGVSIQYVEQDQMLGIAHAVGQLEPHLSHPFLLFLGDIFFETTGLSSLVESFDADGVRGVLAVKVEEDRAALRRNFTVEVNDAGFVTRVVEKPREPRTNLKGCGLYLFDPAIFDAIRRTPRTALRDEYELTDAIQIFIDGGNGVVPAPVVQNDLNLSEPRDLLELNLHVMRERGLERYVSEGLALGPDVRIENSVLMTGSQIPDDVEMVDCVVLPGGRVPAGRHRRMIFAAGEAVDCSAD